MPDVGVVGRLLRRERLLSVMVVTLVALLFAMGVGAIWVSHETLHTRDATAAAASRRIDLMAAQIKGLQTDLTALDAVSAANNAAAAAARAELLTKVDALTAQVRQLGGKPVVVVTPVVQPSSAATTTTAPTQPRSTTTSTSTTTTAPPRTTTTTCPTVPFVGLCRP